MAEAESDRLASAFGIDPASQAALFPTMPAKASSAGALFLGHESCTLSGKVLQVGMGTVSRLAVVRAQGISGDEITDEEIAANLATIMDLTDAHVPGTTSIVP